MYIKINNSRFQTAILSNYAGKNTPEAIQVDCEAPSKYHKLKTDYQDFSGVEQWEADTSKKQEVIALLRARLNEQRTTEEDSCFSYLSKNIQCDPRSRERIAAVVRIAQMNPDFEIDWVCADNTNLHLTNAQIIEMGNALDSFASQTFYKYKALKDALQSKTTAELIELLNT